MDRPTPFILRMGIGEPNLATSAGGGGNISVKITPSKSTMGSTASRSLTLFMPATANASRYGPCIRAGSR